MYVFFWQDRSAALAGMLLHSTAKRRGEDTNRQGATMVGMHVHSTTNAMWQDTHRNGKRGTWQRERGAGQEVLYTLLVGTPIKYII